MAGVIRNMAAIGALETSGGGSGGGALLVNAVLVDGSVTLDKTFKEIETAFKTIGVHILGEFDVDGSVIEQCMYIANTTRYDAGPQYTITAYDISSMEQPYSFVTNSENGYPAASLG